MHNLHTILVPIDLDSIDHTAYELSCSLAQQYGARLIVLFVGQAGKDFRRTADLVWGDDCFSSLEPPNGQASLCAELRRTLPPVAEVQTEYLARAGVPSAEILVCAQQKQADLIVIGTNGKGMLSQMLGGSVSQEVIKQAPCSVFVLRAPSRTSGAIREAAKIVHESSSISAH